jgi:hypothetical protein
MASLADVPEGTYNVAISGDLSFLRMVLPVAVKSIRRARM